MKIPKHIYNVALKCEETRDENYAYLSTFLYKNSCNVRNETYIDDVFMEFLEEGEDPREVLGEAQYNDGEYKRQWLNLDGEQEGYYYHQCLDDPSAYIGYHYYV